MAVRCLKRRVVNRWGGEGEPVFRVDRPAAVRCRDRANARSLPRRRASALSAARREAQDAAVAGAGHVASGTDGPAPADAPLDRELSVVVGEAAPPYHHPRGDEGPPGGVSGARIHEAKADDLAAANPE